VAPESLLQDLHDLDVGYIIFIVTLVRSIISVFGLRGYISELLFTVIALLVDRSLGNLGCIE
jgi:hypothetical protein